MQMLYAVDFDVSVMHSDSATDAYNALLDHVHKWLSWGTTTSPSLIELRNDGQAEYSKISVEGKPESIRKATWALTGSDTAYAFRIDIRQPLLVDGAWFQTRITVSHDCTQARLRVVMGRDITTGWLSPAPFDILRRPRLILDVTRDPLLNVHVFGQLVDNRNVRIQESAEINELAEALRGASRLPILVVSPSTESGRDFAYRSARELQGLARVVTLRPHLSHAFNEQFLNDQVPFGGARLYWPDLSLRQPYFSPETVETNDVDYTVQQLMRLLAPISVISRGRDLGWMTAAAAAREERVERTQQRLDDVRATGDRHEEIRLLTASLNEKTAELAEWESLNELLMTEKEQLQGQLELTESHRYQADHWKSEYFKLASTQDNRAEINWSDAPEVSNQDIERLLAFLTGASAGSFAYTKNAIKSWLRSDYPYPSAMRDALIDLARASIGYREAGGRSSGRLEDWIEARFPLRIAMSDRGLVREGLDRFEFNGRHYRRVPHVKLDDHTSPQRVGRIYFGIDSDELRFIIDHIGLKLYGL